MRQLIFISILSALLGQVVQAQSVYTAVLEESRPDSTIGYKLYVFTKIQGYEGTSILIFSDQTYVYSEYSCTYETALTGTWTLTADSILVLEPSGTYRANREKLIETKKMARTTRYRFAEDKLVRVGANQLEF